MNVEQEVALALEKASGAAPGSEAAPWGGFSQGRKLIVEQAPVTAQLYQLVPNAFCMD